jgi:hypothetical protein
MVENEISGFRVPDDDIKSQYEDYLVYGKLNIGWNLFSQAEKHIFAEKNAERWYSNIEPYSIL